MLITGRDILESIKDVCASEEAVYLVVAYWSGGAAELLHGIAGDKMHIVLDVNAGGTSPVELKFLRDALGEQVRVHPDLHAKIYASRNSAIVGSANATAPGLQIRETERVEAVVKLGGESAIKVYEFSRKLYGEAEPVTADHLRICKERFGRRTLSQSQLNQIERLPLLEALENQPELFGHLPLIVTNEEADETERRTAWEEQRETLGVEAAESFDLGRWDNFAWRLPDSYNEKICLALHNGGKSGVYAGLVRPIVAAQHEWTFARRISWNALPGISYNGARARPLPPSEARDAVYQAVNELINREQEELQVWDLLKILNNSEAW